MLDLISHLELTRLAERHSRDLVRHTQKGYVGWTDGITKIAKHFENPADTEGVRVRLPEGTVVCASRENLARIRPEEFVSSAHEQVARYVDEQNRVAALKRQEIESRHRLRLEEGGFTYRGVRQRTSQLRWTHCWSCKSLLTSATELECAACGWILCKCGACGCGYARA